jgi:hypothetical protein
MPKLSPEIKQRLTELDHKTLQEIVSKLAAKNQLAYDFILTNYLNKGGGEAELYEKTMADIDAICCKRHKGFSDELRVANMMGACVRRINQFTAISKNPKLEADLLMYVLDIPFSLSHKMFGTCFTKYDTKTAIILKRLINVVAKKMHEDLRADYRDKINEYLRVLHSTSRHIDTVYNMVREI